MPPSLPYVKDVKGRFRGRALWARSLVLPLAMAAACGAEAEPVPALQRLALTPAPGSVARPQRCVFSTLGLELAAAAQGEGLEARPGEAGAGHFSGGNSHVLRLALVDDTGAKGIDVGGVDALALELASGVDLGLSAALTLADGKRVATPVVLKTPRGERRRVVLEWRAPRPAGERATELVLSATRRSGALDWTLFEAEVIARPIEARVPPEVRAIEVAGVQRVAWGVTAAMPLVSRVRVPASGGVLHYAHLLAQGSPPDARLALEVSGEVLPLDPPEVEGSTQETPPASETVWQRVTLDMERYGGQTVDIRFRVEAPRPAPASDAGADSADAGFWVAEPFVGAKRPNAPSVLLITSDTHRADHVGFLSSDPGWTPAIDALARRGVVFERALACSNVTIPSHVALMTGIDPVTTGVDDNHTRLADRARTLAEAFRDAGYLTFASTSVRLLSDTWCGLGQGFDRHGGPVDGHEPGRVAVERLERWLDDAEDLPLFAWLHVYDAHRPYDPPDVLRARHYPADKDAFDPALPEPDFPHLPGTPGLRDADWALAGYRGEIGLVDRGLAPLLERARFARGLIAFTADHGEGLGAHGVYWNHVGLYPDTLHVPLVLAGPGIPAGQRIPRIVRQIDLARTLLEAAGLDGGAFPGENLLEETEAEPYFALASESQAASITLGRWHLILILRGVERTRDAPAFGVFERHAVELYDLDTDPGCNRERSADERDLAGRLRARLVEWLVQSGDPLLSIDVGGAAEAPDEELLAQLGYASAASSEHARIDPECDCARCAEFR